MLGGLLYLDENSQTLIIFIVPGLIVSLLEGLIHCEDGPQF